KTPSLQVYYKTHTAYCFSSNCKTHGKSLDVIDFVMHQENCTKHEALEKCKELINGTALQSSTAKQLTIHVRGHFCRVYTRRFSFIVKSSLAQLLDPLPKGLLEQAHRNLAVTREYST